jgi:hypothetical protein
MSKIKVLWWMTRFQQTYDHQMLEECEGIEVVGYVWRGGGVSR